MTDNQLMRRAGAELLGTAFLLAAVVGSGIMADKLANGAAALALLCNTLPVAGILYVMITVLGPVSGAHFNPAVTFAFAWRGETSWSDAVAYWCAQILGGVLGVLLAHVMFDLDVLQVSSTARGGVGQIVSEMVATFGLVLTILAVVRSRPSAVPACVGLYILAAYWFTASTSFANPAVTIARAFTETYAGIHPAGVPAFVAVQFVGAALGVLAAAWFAPAATQAEAVE